MALIRDLEIHQFRPDPDTFDAHSELLVVRFEASQRLYASYIGTWAIAIDDPTMPQSFLQLFLRPEYRFRTPDGVQIDKARVGEIALFSELHRANRNLWQSSTVVTDITPIRRRSNMQGRLDLRGRR